MTLRVYNTLSQQKELFQTVRPGKVGIYLCGPTVYKSPHIGHMVGPVIFDAIKRYLQFKGYEVTWVVNITDVDDKLIDAAARLNTTVKELADKHTAEYFECLQLLGVNTIDQFPKATAHINEIIEMCQTLIEKGYAYAAEANVWFDVAKDADYGKLSHRHVEEQEPGARGSETGGKRNAADFALWKAAKAGEISWESPWGKGRPGWHIECSAMSIKLLGPSFDIHGGGMDLLFPHHENELAQSESATGQPFARYWMHNGLTRVNTKKITGSDMWDAEGAKALAAVAAKKLVGDHGAEVLRYLLLSTHYRRPIEFSENTLSDTKKALGAFHRLFERIDRLAAGQPAVTDDMDRASSALLDGEHASYARAVLAMKMKFLEMMDDDFNTAGAIGVLHELAGEVNAFLERNDADRAKPQDVIVAAGSGVLTLRTLGGVIGLFQKAVVVTGAAPTREGLTAKLMDLLILLRADARKTKNFTLADDIRKGLTAAGVTIEDGPEGTRWRTD